MTAESAGKPYPWLVAGVVLAVFIGAGHAWSLDTGLFLDDHAHYKHLNVDDWSYQLAVDASRLGIIGDVLDIWSKREAGLRFYRPVAFWTMKLGYTLVGWEPAGMHVISLFWHWVASMLVGRLAYGFLRNRGWAVVAAGIFAVHPGNIVSVYWIATQSELLVTIGLILSTLCYARFSGWRSPWLDDGTPVNTPARWPWLAPAALCFAGALGCRENAVMLLPVLIVADLLMGLRLRRWPAYLALAAMVAVYLFMRQRALGEFPLPPRPYLIGPWEPDFIPFVAAKFAHYSLGLFAYVPIIPVGGQVYFEERLTKFLLSFGGVVLGWILLAVFVRRRALALPFAWIFLGMLPTLPVFSSPHHLYMPSVGVALILTTALAFGAGHLSGQAPIRKPAREFGAVVAVALHAIGLTLGCWAMGWVYRSTTIIEDQLIDDIVALEHERRPIRSGDHLFFINLPTMAYYAIPALEQATGVKDLRGHVLTFSPSPLLMENPCIVSQRDEHSFTIELEGGAYFSGTAGKVLVEAMKLDYPFKAGQKVDAGMYQVRIDEVDDAGATKITFTFERPLDDPSYHFLLTSRARMAYPLRFDGPSASAGNRRS
jgi:hypothetical protein